MGINKPVINIYYSSEIKNISKYYELLWGIEEEGLPYNVESQTYENSVRLGYEAAENSILKVGFGIGIDGYIVLHYEDLNENNPLFKLKIETRADNLRIIGSNGARLVKGLPFKSFIEDNIN